jgi:hypothetical protein
MHDPERSACPQQYVSPKRGSIALYLSWPLKEASMLWIGGAWNYETFPPCFIVEGKRQLRAEKIAEIRKKCRPFIFRGKEHAVEVYATPGGGQTKESMMWWTKEVFVKKSYPDCSASHPSKQVVLWLDWHDSRLGIEWLKYCWKVGIIVRMLIPNATNKMQKEDVRIFGVVKGRHERAVHDFLVQQRKDKLGWVDAVQVYAALIRDVCTPSLWKSSLTAIGMRDPFS